MSLRRSTRQSAVLVAKKNEASPSPSSTTRKRANGKSDSRQTNTKRVKEASPDDAPATDPAAFKVPQVPVTPGRRRSAKAMKAPQLTPTPSLVGLMRTPFRSGDTSDANPPPSKPTILFFLAGQSNCLLLVIHDGLLPPHLRFCISAPLPAVHRRPCRTRLWGLLGIYIVSRVTLTISWQTTVQLSLTLQVPLW